MARKRRERNYADIEWDDDDWYDEEPRHKGRFEFGDEDFLRVWDQNPFDDRDVDIEIPSVPDDYKEKKYATRKIGNINTGARSIWTGSATHYLYRGEEELMIVPRGLDNTNRIGDRVYATRVSVRVVTFLDPAYSNLVANNNGWSGYDGCLMRFFIFVDKTRRWGLNYPRRGWSLGAGNSANAPFVEERGFLYNDSINSFYNTDTIKNYRILVDTGVIETCVDYAGENFPIGAFGGTLNPTNTRFSVLEGNVDPTMLINTTLVSDNDFPTDEVVGTINAPEFTLVGDGVYATPGGVGDAAYTFGMVALDSGSVTFDGVRARSNITSASEFTPEITLTARQTGINRIRYTKPKPCTKTFEWNIDLNGMMVQWNENFDGEDPNDYPSDNGLRFGVLFYSSNYNMCYQVDTRVEFVDD